jgi:hypothetical protein
MTNKNVRLRLSNSRDVVRGSSEQLKLIHLEDIDSTSSRGLARGSNAETRIIHCVAVTLLRCAVPEELSLSLSLSHL